MHRAVVFVFVACCALSALSLAEEAEDAKPPATESPPGSFDTTTSTASTNKTTTSPTNTTTTKPPTPPTNTTTTKPTTPSTNTTTTKPAPTTTNATTTKPTTTKPTTTPTTTQAPPAPTPSTSVPLGRYNLTNQKDKKICLMAQMGLKIRLISKEANGTFIVQPNKTTTSGFCGETSANLTLSFSEGVITFLFNKSVANNTAYVDAVLFSVSIDKGARSAKNESIHLFTAKIGRSYSCKNESVYMGNGLYLEVSQDRLQAFNVTNNDFGLPDNCPADQPDYRVAIAVGVTLLVLIVVVVVVYLLGRRKRTDGYQSL